MESGRSPDCPAPTLAKVLSPAELEEFRLRGSPTANALRNDDQEGTGLLLQNLDDSIQQLLNYRATVGARAIRLDTTDNRLLDIEVSFTTMLSGVEDADITKLVTDLSTQENAYKAALMATAKIIQPSLLDFIR